MKMKIQGLEVFLQERHGTRDMNLYISIQPFPGADIKMYYSDKVVDYKEEGLIEKPSFILTPDMLSGLMAELTRKGIKPPAHSFVEGKLEATERHLEDMRALVFEKTEITGVTKVE